MKTYTKPEINIVILNNKDVITVSGGINLASSSFDSTKTYTAITY